MIFRIHSIPNYTQHECTMAHKLTKMAEFWYIGGGIAQGGEIATEEVLM